MIRSSLLALCLSSLLPAQELDLSFLKDAESKASEATNITLGKEQLQLIRGLSGGLTTGQNSADLAALAEKIELVQVKVLEFDKPGMFPLAEMDKLRLQVKGADMLPLISVKEREGFTEVLMRKGPKGNRGFVILAVEPRELTVVNIVGDLDLASLGKLSGKLGIPNVEFGNLGAASGSGKGGAKSPSPSPGKKDDDEEPQL